MNVVFEGIELLTCFVESYLLYLIYDGLFEKHRKIQDRKYLIVLAIIESFLIRFCNHISVFSYFTIFVFVIYMSISATIIYRRSVVQLFSIASFYALCISVLDSFVISLFSNLWNVQENLTKFISQPNVLRMGMIILMKTVDVFVFLMIRKYLYKISSRLKHTCVIFILSCMGFAGYAFLMNQMFHAPDITMTGTWLLFIVLLLLELYITYFMVMLREEKMKLDFAEKRNYLLEENYKSIQEIYMKNAKLYHDLNNHLNMLYQILDERDVDGAKEYIEEISRPIKSLSKTVWTGVDVVDVILNSKIDRMEQKGIFCECNVEFPKHTNLSTHDICTILTNLLDNAIEAAQLSEGERKISLTIRRVEHFLLIKISNTCSGENKSFVHFPATTKENKELHGWGLSNVKDAVDKYNGTLKCIREGNQFTVNVLLFFELVSEGSGKEERQ